MLPAEFDQFWFRAAHGNQLNRTLLKLVVFLLLKWKTKQRVKRKPKEAPNGKSGTGDNLEGHVSSSRELLNPPSEPSHKLGGSEADLPGPMKCSQEPHNVEHPRELWN